MANRGDRVIPSTTACLFVSLVVVLAGVARAMDERGSIRDGFESEKPVWRQEKTDTEVRLYAHDRSKGSVREGQTAEHFQFEAGNGSGFYFSYALPRIPITPTLGVSLQVRSDHSGQQLLARVVLPADIDPETNRPSFVLVPGTILDVSDRWARLELVDLPLGVERQARVLRASSRRKVSLEGAYLDRLIVNLYGGPGRTEVYLDDLRISPVPSDLVEAFERGSRGRPGADLPPLPATEAAGTEPAAEGTDPAAKKARGGYPVKIDRNMLTRQGLPWFPTIVRAPGADPAKLARAGFDVVALPSDSDPALIKEAVAAKLALMVEIDPGRAGDKLDPNRVQQIIDRFPAKESVAFWSLGRNLGSAIGLKPRTRERDRVRDIAQELRRQKEFSGLSTGEVVGFLNQYVRAPDHLDLIGVRPQGWGTTQQPEEMQLYLKQRQLYTELDNHGALFYPWLQMFPDPYFQEAVWGRDRPPSWGIPRVLPAQLRQAAYSALSAGCRGLAFDADQNLTLGAGRSMLIEAALLNEEVDLIEWLLADTSRDYRPLKVLQPDDPKTVIQQGVNAMRNAALRKPEKPPHPTIRAAAFTTKDMRGTLVIVNDLAGGSQFQPPQLSAKNIRIEVPGLADEAQGYEISPGEVRVLDHERVPGGIRLTLEEFTGTALIFVTTVGERIDEIQRAVVSVRPRAVNLRIEQVQAELAWGLEIHRLLTDDGHKFLEADELVSQAQDRMKSAIDAYDRMDYEIAWKEARRSSRSLQMLLRFHWELAVKEYSEMLKDKKQACGPKLLPGHDKEPLRVFSPVCIPPLVSCATLPQAWVWKDWISRGPLGGNLLSSGGFEDPQGLGDAGWVNESYDTPGSKSEFIIRAEKAGPDQFRRVLELSGRPIDPNGLDLLPGSVDQLVAAVRSPPIKVSEGEMIRIAVLVTMPTDTVSGAGGVIIRDSIGGEPLQFRSTAAIPGYQEVVIYRRAPVDGEMTVLLGYAGHQFARFDNLRIQKIVGAGDPGASPIAETSVRTTR
jgi:hypothetical protein